VLGPGRDGCHAGVRDRVGDPPFPPPPFFARHDEGHVPVLLRNANSFVIILIYAPVSRRATHQRRRPTGGGGGGGFVYTLLAFAPEISCFPADCRRLRYAGIPGREDVSGGFVWSGRAGPAPRAFSHLCVNGGLYTSPRRHATLSYACRAIIPYWRKVKIARLRRSVLRVNYVCLRGRVMRFTVMN